MKPIKFSHPYKKLIGVGTIARLVHVTEVYLEKVHKSFLHYDTVYFGRGGEEKHYPLPKKGRFILLLFQYENILFTTLRRSTANKYDYYKGSVGEMFEIVRDYK